MPVAANAAVAPALQSFVAMAAGADGSLWVVTSGDAYAKLDLIAPPRYSTALSVLNAADGTVRWKHTQTGHIGSSIVLDASNRGYLTIAGTGEAGAEGRMLQAYGSTGQLRWSRSVSADARAVFNGRIELRNGQTLAAANGADQWLAAGFIEQADKLMHSPLMTGGGIFEPMFPFIDCAESSDEQVPAFEAVSVTFRSNPSGALRVGTTVLAPALGASLQTPVPVTTLSLTDAKLAVASGEAAPGLNLQWLRGINMASQEAFACELPVSPGADRTTYFGVSALLEGRWAAVRHQAWFQGDCVNCFIEPIEQLVVFHTPGLRPAEHGWTAAFGNATRDNRER